MLRWWFVALVACTGVQQRFPDDVQTALAHTSMRRLETNRFVIYYAESKRDEVDRFLARAGHCAAGVRNSGKPADTFADKMVIVMPDVAFNNAFVLPDLEG